MHITFFVRTVRELVVDMTPIPLPLSTSVCSSPAHTKAHCAWPTLTKSTIVPPSNVQSIFMFPDSLFTIVKNVFPQLIRFRINFWSRILYRRDPVLQMAPPEKARPRLVVPLLVSTRWSKQQPGPSNIKFVFSPCNQQVTSFWHPASI